MTRDFLWRLVNTVVVSSALLGACAKHSDDAASDSVSKAATATAEQSPTQTPASTTQATQPTAVAAETCEQCEVRQCSNFRGAGVDLIAACYHNPDVAKQAACRAAVECGRKTKCGLTVRGAEQCYCGSATSEACAKGQGIDGPCKLQLEAAAGTASFEAVTTGFGDRTLALGNAVFMLQCDRDFCAQACGG